MAKQPAIQFAKPALPSEGAIVLLIPTDGKLPPIAGALDHDGRISQAMKTAEFTGKNATVLEIMAPASGIDRLVLAGIGGKDANKEAEWLKTGGKIFAAVSKSAQATIIADGDAGEISGDALAMIAAGAKLRSYDFDTYKTKDRKEAKLARLTFAAESHAAAKKAFKTLDGVTDGVMTARDLVNEPANILGPVEFAERAKALEKLGVEVEVLEEKALRKLKMGALLGVAQGSVRPPRLVVMKWNGGKAKDQPLAFIGKGVVFDTGGISIKPAAGMEDMKGDMGGAAAVTGLMHALAARKAKANVIGIIGLVENMPDGNAQRPGDIVTSMSGQTIEVINTDAEGRLVLADALWYCQDRFKPKFMINLATLTGAIMIALGQSHAGLFSNNDELSANLTRAGLDTDERVWRMPMGPDYDKLIDSKFADMKNIGGRFGGSITAAQFLQRFVNDVPWAHLDIAGTAMGSPKNEYSQSWGSGYGVRLLDRLVANDYE
ncbi:MAG: leucyl aminopeptidase [Nitratireductor sp.]